MSANTRHATGNENFCWMAMTSGCADIPLVRLTSASSLSWAIVFSFSPGWRLTFGNTSFGFSPRTMSAVKRVVAVSPFPVL